VKLYRAKPSFLFSFYKRKQRITGFASVRYINLLLILAGSPCVPIYIVVQWLGYGAVDRWTGLSYSRWWFSMRRGCLACRLPCHPPARPFVIGSYRCPRRLLGAAAAEAHVCMHAAMSSKPPYTRLLSSATLHPDGLRRLLHT